MDPNEPSPSPEQRPPVNQPPYTQPPNYSDSQSPYGQPPTQPPYAQPSYTQPQYQPQTQASQPTLPQSGSTLARLNAFRRQRPILAGVLGLIVACIVCAACGGTLSAMNGGSNSNNAIGNTSASKHTSTGPTVTATMKPTPVPTESPAQYRDSAKSVTVSDIAKAPNAYSQKVVTFQGIIASFVPDSNGNNTAANVADPNDYSTVIVIEFSPGFNVQNVNKGDSITVWGQGDGSLTGTNAYGATIHEGAVQEVYLHDSSTGYTDNSVTDPATYVSNLP